ncbi:DUF805 domain-containing protein [Paragemmobacter ruber]|uniref:DUF805 domain-containing protein n=1 Tax=Paragemmobacter ruber TaxID=1985673 RepID=A0ABW9Y773_9RHOB|nr:DUF805 domain-containing protein [Rhodobacter ruber]NBE07655.1 DUF805 domain-containing protein [Rhodobacter ruber]
MNMIEAVKAVFSKYATFEGRARRSEYWWFFLFSMIIALILNVISPGLLGGIWALVTLLPSIAVGARRLHDIDRTGWWLLIGFIPLIGLIVLIVFFIKRGDTLPNRFGLPPIPA